MSRPVQSESLRDDRRSSNAPDVSEPQPYDFHDWQSFQDDVLRYHASTLPKANRVDDRIHTFRKFMKPGVIQYLRNKRPGIFEIGEFDDWNHWLATTTALLSARDSSINGGALSNRFDDVAESWARRYRDGNMSERQLWSELKALVDKETISTERQVQVFWESHSGEQQQKLVRNCPHLDPSDRVWDASTGYADRTAAQRLVNGVMESDIDARVELERGDTKVFSVVFCILTTLAITMWVLLARVNFTATGDTAVIITGIFSTSFALFAGIGALKALANWTDALKLQKEYSLGVWPNSVHQSGEGLLHDVESIDVTKT